MTKALRTQLLVAFMCVALLVYFALLGRVAVAMIASGRAAAVGLGLAVLVMPVIGLWAMVATIAHRPMTGMTNTASPRPTAAARPEAIMATATRPSSAKYTNSATHMKATSSWVRSALVIAG